MMETDLGSVIRIRITPKERSLDQFSHGCLRGLPTGLRTFKIVDLSTFEREALEYFLKKKVDVFVNLPTGYGKSLKLCKTYD